MTYEHPSRGGDIILSTLCFCKATHKNSFDLSSFLSNLLTRLVQLDIHVCFTYEGKYYSSRCLRNCLGRAETARARIREHDLEREEDIVTTEV